MNANVHPPKVVKLHYAFDGWLGDAILESFPSFIMTEAAMRRVLAANLTGVKFDEVETTKSEQFQELHPNRQLPKFLWLKVEGQIGCDDFALTNDGRLVVSERAVEVLSTLGLSRAVIKEII